ncbi:MAG TPA: nucleotidyltransferase domain-containing protein [Bacteroidales bacterium]|nr:nucleotidyltransferase domain-containing protein [Bacteroidales bacterium]HOE04442.1 nucleotidyltransferase domain-containing protein [Bacteroidales bacterium]
MSELNKYGLSEENLANVIAIISAHPKVKKIILFGSRAKGNFNKGSDIDIAVSGEHIELNDILNLLIVLDNLDLAYKFDIIIFENIQSEELKEHIERIGIVLYDKAITM